MKTLLLKTLLAPVLLAVTAISICGQNVEVQSPKAPAVTAPAAKIPSATPQPPKLPGERKVQYSGFVVETARAGKPLRGLSLKTPADPARDGTNVVTGLRAETGRGIKFFSFDF